MVNYTTSKPTRDRSRIYLANTRKGEAKMRAFYDAWWAELEPTFARTTELHIGHHDHPVVTLTSHDWIQEAYPLESTTKPGKITDPTK